MSAGSRRTWFHGGWGGISEAVELRRGWGGRGWMCLRYRRLHWDALEEEEGEAVLGSRDCL